MVNDFEEAIAAFVAMPETKQIAQPEELNISNIDIGQGQHHIKK